MHFQRLLISLIEGLLAKPNHGVHSVLVAASGVHLLWNIDAIDGRHAAGHGQKAALTCSQELRLNPDDHDH